MSRWNCLDDVIILVIHTSLVLPGEIDERVACLLSMFCFYIVILSELSIVHVCLHFFPLFVLCLASSEFCFSYFLICILTCMLSYTGGK